MKTAMVGALVWFSPVGFLFFLSILFTLKKNKNSSRGVGKKSKDERSDSVGLHYLCGCSQSCQMRKKYS